MRSAATLLLCLIPVVAQAKPVPVQEFNGDRWVRVAQPARAANPAARRHVAKPKRTHQRASRGQRRPVKIGLVQGLKREAVEAMPSRWLVGIVPPLAAKAREIVAACGSKVISGVRHTYIAGTGGRLSLHASGRAVDIAKNPACIYSHLHGWPGGYSTDYHARGIQHVHISYAPGGPEWGRRFAHYGARRHRQKYRRRA